MAEVAQPQSGSRRAALRARFRVFDNAGLFSVDAAASRLTKHAVAPVLRRCAVSPMRIAAS